MCLLPSNPETSLIGRYIHFTLAISTWKGSYIAALTPSNAKLGKFYKIVGVTYVGREFVKVVIYNDAGNAINVRLDRYISRSSAHLQLKTHWKLAKLNNKALAGYLYNHPEVSSTGDNKEINKGVR
jgi:hypothetical protein